MSVPRLLTRAFATAFIVAGLVTAIPATASADAPAKKDVQHCVVTAGSTAMTCVGADEVSAQVTCSDFGYVRGATMWEFRDRGGSSLTFCVPRQCSASYDDEGSRFNWPDLAGWNNRGSSVDTYNSCDIKLWGMENFNGASSTWIDQSMYLGNVGDGWNNRASSVKLS